MFLTTIMSDLTLRNKVQKSKFDKQVRRSLSTIRNRMYDRFRFHIRTQVWCNTGFLLLNHVDQIREQIQSDDQIPGGHDMLWYI